MSCEQCELVSNYQCVPCSVSGQCPSFQPRQDTTIQELPSRLQTGAGPWSRGPYNLTAGEEVRLACEAGFAAVVPGMMLFEEPQVILDGSFTVRCEVDGTLSHATATCGCLPPAITVNPESGDRFSCVCPAGYYGTIPFGEFGSIDCERCPDHSSSIVRTSTLDGCKCNAGYYSEDVTDCKECPPRSYSNPGSRTLTDCLCAEGTYRENLLNVSSDCIYCPAHSDSDFDSRHITECTCNAGYDGNGGTGCLKCDLVSSTWRQNLVCDDNDDNCVMHSLCDCRASYYGNGVSCTICPGGATSMPRTTDVTGCVCPVGTYLLGVECESCPPHSTSPMGSTNVTDCLCHVAYYFDRTINECQSCPPMKISQVGSNSQAECFCDYIYRPENGTCYPCPVMSNYDPQLGICICQPGYVMQGPADDENSICVVCKGHFALDNKNLELDPE